MAKSKTDTDTGVQDDAAELRRQLAEAQADRDTYKSQAQTATGRAREAEMANMGAQERALVADQEACAGRIEAFENELSSMEAEIGRLADEPGHGAEVAKLTRQMGATAAKLETETNRKTWLDGKREEFKTRKEAKPEADTGEDKTANGTSISTFGPKTQAFIRANPRLLTDLAYYNRAVAAATAATGLENLKDQSPEYFSFIEEKLGIRQASEQDEGEEEEEDEGEDVVDDAATRRAHEQGRAVREQPRAAGEGSIAPVIRQTPHGSGGGNRRTPTLSAEEKEVALSLYAHIPNISDADKLKRYADGRKYMKERANMHFTGNN